MVSEGAGVADQVGEAYAAVRVAEQVQRGVIGGEQVEEVRYAVVVAYGVLGQGTGPASKDRKGRPGQRAEDLLHGFEGGPDQVRVG